MPSYRVPLLLLPVLALGCSHADDAIAAEIRRRLATDATRAAVVITKKGVVVLQGRVDGVAQQQAAIEAAAAVPGVRKVVNQLGLTDAAIVEAVKEALRSDRELAGVPIEVTSLDGVVRLASSATSAEQRERAVALVRAVPGVVHVNDEMK